MENIYKVVYSDAVDSYKKNLNMALETIGSEDFIKKGIALYGLQYKRYFKKYRQARNINIPVKGPQRDSEIQLYGAEYGSEIQAKKTAYAALKLFYTEEQIALLGILHNCKEILTYMNEPTADRIQIAFYDKSDSPYDKSDTPYPLYIIDARPTDTLDTARIVEMDSFTHVGELKNLDTLLEETRKTIKTLWETEKGSM